NQSPFREFPAPHEKENGIEKAIGGVIRRTDHRRQQSAADLRSDGGVGHPRAAAGLRAYRSGAGANRVDDRPQQGPKPVIHAATRHRARRLITPWGRRARPAAARMPLTIFDYSALTTCQTPPAPSPVISPGVVSL